MPLHLNLHTDHALKLPAAAHATCPDAATLARALVHLASAFNAASVEHLRQLGWTDEELRRLGDEAKSIARRLAPTLLTEAAA